MAHRALHVSATDGSFAVREIDDPAIVGPIDFAWKLGDAGRVHTTFGAGPLAGGFLPGSNRLVVVGWSPIWDMFYPSTIGGAGLPWQALGVRFVALSGRARVPSVLSIARAGGALRVSVDPVDAEALWRGHGDEIGLYALMRAVHERADFAVGRVLAVGPAAARTRAGAIGSAPIARGELTHIDTWAGRGGLGSRLYREHGIAAVVIGGERPDDPLAEKESEHSLSSAERLVGERYGGRSLKLVDLEETKKYRFDPDFKTGGTFGSNYHRLRERALSFNYRSVSFSDETRVAIHERLIAGHYLAQFDREITRAQGPKKSFTCGEPCSATCKKVDGKFKKDYEPYQAMGPLIGVFDQRAAEEINHLANGMGFDAVELGGDLAWLMECLERGWLGEAETGIAERPRWDPDALEPVGDSAHNASIGRRLIAWILDDRRAAPMRDGLRTAATALGGAAAQAAVYNANGDEHGCMVPNQYWVPGMFAPVPIMGRYYLDYDYEWKPPRELGRSCAARMVNELMLDNYGMCRFHRGWAEKVLPGIVNATWGIDVDATQHHRQLSLELHGMNRSQPWQTERIVELVHRYLEKVRDDGPHDPALDAWIDRFAANPREAAGAYWREMAEGFDAGLRS